MHVLVRQEAAVVAGCSWHCRCGLLLVTYRGVTIGSSINDTNMCEYVGSRMKPPEQINCDPQLDMQPHMVACFFPEHVCPCVRGEISGWFFCMTVEAESAGYDALSGSTRCPPAGNKLKQ